MNKYLQALKKENYTVWALEEGIIQAFAFEADRWWSNEGEGYFDPDIVGDPYPVSALISPNGMMELINSQEGYPLEVPSIRIEQAAQLPDILQSLKRAHCNETTIKGGAKIILDLLM